LSNWLDGSEKNPYVRARSSYKCRCVERYGSSLREIQANGKIAKDWEYTALSVGDQPHPPPPHRRRRRLQTSPTCRQRKLYEIAHRLFGCCVCCTRRRLSPPNCRQEMHQIGTTSDLEVARIMDGHPPIHIYQNQLPPPNDCHFTIRNPYFRPPQSSSRRNWDTVDRCIYPHDDIQGHFERDNIEDIVAMVSGRETDILDDLVDSSSASEERETCIEGPRKVVTVHRAPSLGRRYWNPQQISDDDVPISALISKSGWLSDFGDQRKPPLQQTPDSTIASTEHSTVETGSTHDLANHLLVPPTKRDFVVTQEGDKLFDSSKKKFADLEFKNAEPHFRDKIREAHEVCQEDMPKNAFEPTQLNCYQAEPSKLDDVKSSPPPSSESSQVPDVCSKNNGGNEKGADGVGDDADDSDDNEGSEIGFLANSRESSIAMDDVGVEKEDDTVSTSTTLSSTSSCSVKDGDDETEEVDDDDDDGDEEEMTPDEAVDMATAEAASEDFVQTGERVNEADFPSPQTPPSNDEASSRAEPDRNTASPIQIDPHIRARWRWAVLSQNRDLVFSNENADEKSQVFNRAAKSFYQSIDSAPERRWNKRTLPLVSDLV
uniref:HYLS1_C domain-containing protein n=1 Tax=Mesocestoides corti TaxID=53468 RepID=A0A5K3FJS7_MESCO